MKFVAGMVVGVVVFVVGGLTCLWRYLDREWQATP